MIKRIIYILEALLLCGFFSLQVKAQDPTVSLPTIIPPSPLAENFMRYGEIPVDYSTGVPDISIPIYTLEGRKLKIPISISYHASGIKVEDIPSEVGLGWVLNCGGIIARTVNELQDESRTANRTFSSAQQLLDSVTEAAPIYDPSCQCMENIANFESYFTTNFKYEDPMSDRYYYSLPDGTTGVFTHNYPGGDTLITLPYRPWKIVEYTNSGMTDSIMIRDDNGTAYLFQSLLNIPERYTEWYLKRMVSADKTDTISFFYTIEDAHPSAANMSQALVSNTPDVGSNCELDGVTTYSYSTALSPTTSFNTPLLDSVVSSQAIIRFQYATRNDFATLQRLSEITISPTNSPSDTIRNIQFTPEYFGSTSDDERLGLDNLIISAPGMTPQQYSFTYNSMALPPYPSKMTNPTFSEDFWGYYNGSSSSTRIPADFITNATYRQAYGADRYPDSTGYFSEACMLEAIEYPTGGRTVFQFERNYAPNVYMYKSNTSGYVGGFRIHSITNYNDSNEVTGIKTYGYAGAKACSFNQYYFEYSIEDYNHYDYMDPQQGWQVYCWSRSPDTIILSDPLLPLDVAPGMPVMYTVVTEYDGTPSDNSGKTVFTYNPPYSPSDFIDNPEHPVQWELPWFYNPYQYDKGNYVPEMTSKTAYSYDGTNYHPVYKEEYTYTDLFTKEFETGIKLTRTAEYSLAPPEALYMDESPYDLDAFDYIQTIVAIDAKAYQQATLLTNTKAYTFDPQDSTKYVLTSTDYIYNENNLAIQEKSTLSSKGDTLRTFYKYPIDYTGTEVYDTMVSRNIISPVIEELFDKNSNFLQSTETNYNFWNGSAWSAFPTDIIVPQTMDTKTLTQSSYETRIRYQAYGTKANVLSVSKENDALHSYIWDYNNSYPVAEAINASQSDIAYTSFEADGKGNWTFNGTPVSTAGGITGSMAYPLSSGSISKSGLTSGTSYIVSYWLYSGGGVGISGGTQSNSLTGKTIDGWTYHEVTITGTTSISLSGGGFIDELRLYPADAQMTTYTYEPLIGMTSRCDAKNNITYYEYDGFGRLKLVRDEDGHILKQYDYQYQASNTQ